MHLQKGKSSSLIVTVVIALTIAIICSSLILFNLNNNSFESLHWQEQKLNDNLSSAVTLALTGNENNQLSIDLFGSGNDSAFIKKDYWGGFPLAKVSVTGKGKEKDKVFLYGTDLPDSLDGCIYLADHNRPLLISGNTSLIGNSFLPKSGIIKGQISNAIYEGVIKRSDKSLPHLNEQMVSQCRSLLLKSRSGSIESPLPADSIDNSFNSITKEYFLQAEGVLSALSVIGNIIIYSDSVIEVNPDCNLKDIILVAPSIRVKDHFNGSLQLIASDSISIGNDCYFSYPSFIFLDKDDNVENRPQLHIGQKCSFNGAIVCLSNNRELIKTDCRIGNDCIFNGWIYSQGLLSLSQNIHFNGTVFADIILYRSPVGTFENRLEDIHLSRKGLSEYFAGPSLFSSNTKNSVIKWLH